MLPGYRILRREWRAFRHTLAVLADFRDPDLKVRGCKFAAAFAALHACGCYVSANLENILLECAETIPPVPPGTEFRKGSVLLVMTQPLERGGHTRVVERWLELDHGGRKYDLVKLEHVKKMPETLLQALEKNGGGFFDLAGLPTDRERAAALRKLGAKYEFIVLFTHMMDPVPILAFGTESFTRPVLLFNHADHLFWLGRCIADAVIEFRMFQSYTEERRGISRRLFLPIADSPDSRIDCSREEARRSLGIKEDEKMILIAGGSAKLFELNGKSLLPVLRRLLEQVPGSIGYVVGTALGDPLWSRAGESPQTPITVTGPVPYGKEYFRYVAAADLLIDSWPIGGGTVLGDAIHCGVPVVSCPFLVGQCDYLVRSGLACDSLEELTAKAAQLLSGPDFRRSAMEKLHSLFLQEKAPENWLKHLNAVWENAPREHHTRYYSAADDPFRIDETTFLLNESHHPRFVKNYRRRRWKFFAKSFLCFFFRRIIRNEKKMLRYLPLPCRSDLLRDALPY